MIGNRSSDIHVTCLDNIIDGHWRMQTPNWGRPFPPFTSLTLPFPFPPLPFPSPSPSLLLEVSPLITASGVWGGVPAEIEFGAF